MEENVKQRLIQYLQFKKIGQNKFEKMAGISVGYISNLKKSPGAEQLMKILNAAPDLNKDWLLTGEGEMLVSEDNPIVPAITYNSGRPYYNVDFIGGFDVIFNDQTVNPDYNIDFPPYNKEGVVWCNITGHSMEPQISHGDIIALREVCDWRSFIPMGEVYAIVTANDLRTIKIIRKGDDAEHLRLVPVNRDGYDEQQILKRDILRVFSVLGCIKKM